MLADPFSYYMMSSGRSILASSLLLKFRMWFKYGLKAQKLLAQCSSGACSMDNIT